jgi:flavine halogenase
MNSNLHNIACWGYWEGDYGKYMPGTRRENAPWFEALTGTFHQYRGGRRFLM